MQNPNHFTLERVVTRNRRRSVARILQVTFVLLLAAGILAGVFHFAPRVLHPFRNLPEQPVVAYVHPLTREIEEARRLRATGKLAEAQKFLRQQIHLYPRATPVQQARELLGEINTQLFFSKTNLFGKTEYIVQRGDSLWAIARKLDSTPGAIRRANDLQSSLLQPGDELLVPDNDFTLTLDLPNERLVVHNGDGFFKQYAILDVNLPRSARANITTKVTATTFWKNGAMLSSDADEDADLRIHLDRGG